MAYLQYLVENGVSVKLNMIANNVSALRASFIIYQIDHAVFENPQHHDKHHDLGPFEVISEPV